MDDPRQQVESNSNSKEVFPNERKTSSKTLAIVTLAVISLSGFLIIFFVG